MGRVVVDVMPKPEILDPQGKAVLGALPRLGFEGVTDVRQGKRFELEIDGALTEDRLAEVEKMAETLLSNPVIEDYAVRVLDDETTSGRSASSPSPARWTTPMRGAPYAPAGTRPSRSGTATTRSRAWTRSSCPAASRTATTCAAERSPASPR